MSWIGLVGWRGIGLFLVALAAGQAAAEDPSGKNSLLPLAVRPQAEVESLLAEAQKLADNIQKDLNGYAEARATGKLKALAPRVVGQTVANAGKLQRYAAILELWGEAAGIDYRLRSARFQSDLSDLIRAYRALPGANEGLRRGLTAVGNRAAVLAKDLPTVNKLFTQGKEIDAEGVLNAWFDELEVILCWFDPVDRDNTLKVFRNARDVVFPKALTLRKDMIAGKLAEARRQANPAFADLLTAARTAADTIQTSGKATLAEKSLSGPEVVAALGEKWIAMQAQAGQARALDWARGISPGSPGQKDYDALSEAQQMFAATMPSAIATIVQADAMRAKAEEAPALHAAYLQALAPLVVAGSGLELEKKWEPALAMLAAKSPPLAEEVAAYGRATGEILRWRKLAAESRARGLTMGYVSAPALVAPAVKADAAFAGLLPAESMAPDGAKLRWCVPEVLKRASPQLSGKKVLVSDWIPAPGAAPAMQSRPISRVYARGAIPAEMRMQIDALKRDLQVGENHPPLTLAATAAIYEAEKGFAIQVGLEISDLALVSMIDRQATLAPAEGAWLTLGPLPQESPKLIEAADLYLRLEGAPKWIRFSSFCWEGK